MIYLVRRCQKLGNNNTEKQRERFKEVLKILKKQGISQKMISDKLGRTEDYLSSLKSGKIQKIPDDVLSCLQENFNVNPAYVRGDSSFPLHDIGKPFEHFEKFAPEWETVKHGDRSYLYLSMDSNLYEFLLEVDNIRLAGASGSIDEDVSIKNLKQLYSGSPVEQKYIVIPCDDFQEIIKTSKEHRKQLTEVLDIMALDE